MKQLVEMIVQALVDSPDQVRINETAGESIVILEISVAPEDVGKVIGKEGRIANAIRTVVKAAAAKHDKKVTVEIMTQKQVDIVTKPGKSDATPSVTLKRTVTIKAIVTDAFKEYLKYEVDRVVSGHQSE